MTEIVWSEDALKDYHQIIDFLVTDWSEQAARKFIEEVEDVLYLLERQPELYPLSSFPEVRKAVIRKQITLYYTIQEEKLFLVRFWNTLQDPDKLNVR